MFIQTQNTPNPNVLKFLPGRKILQRTPIEINHKDNKDQIPLANNLFKIKGLKSLFFGSDFISVTKKQEITWNMIKADIFGILMDYFTIHKYIEIYIEKEPKIINKNQTSKIFKEIKELIDSKIRPAVANDGGDITLESFDKGIVLVRMKGACAGCPQSTLTLKSGIENMLRYYIPEVEEVRSISEE